MAEEKGLYTATKKESMGVCFVGNVGMREFLGQYIDHVPGDIIDKETGSVLGRHDGAIVYTLGQRHGLELGGGLPYYVVGKVIEHNRVYVSTKLQDEAMWKKNVELSAVHWINKAESGLECLVRTRHRAPLVSAKLSSVGEGNLQVEFQEPQRAVTAGQSVVFYHGEECLGGGIVA
jgi:tRNA-specific 2-thiouridylase